MPSKRSAGSAPPAPNETRSTNAPVSLDVERELRIGLGTGKARRRLRALLLENILSGTLPPPSPEAPNFRLIAEVVRGAMQDPSISDDRRIRLNDFLRAMEQRSATTPEAIEAAETNDPISEMLPRLRSEYFRERLTEYEAVVYAETDPRFKALGQQQIDKLRAEYDAALKEENTPEFIWERQRVREALAQQYSKPQEAEKPPNLESPSGRAIEPPRLTTPGGTLAEDDDRIITRQGTRYVPISLAAEIAQVPRTTLLDWIKEKKFAGRPLVAYNSPTAHKAFLSDESVQRLANRFVKWDPEKKAPAGPAGAITLGETPDQSGYISLPKAARHIGVDYNTLRLWATQGNAPPVTKAFDVIQDTASQQFYIRQAEVTELKRLIPKRGLHRGRRPQRAAHQS